MSYSCSIYTDAEFTCEEIMRISGFEQNHFRVHERGSYFCSVGGIGLYIDNRIIYKPQNHKMDWKWSIQLDSWKTCMWLKMQTLLAYEILSNLLDHTPGNHLGFNEGGSVLFYAIPNMIEIDKSFEFSNGNIISFPNTIYKDLGHV